MIKADEQTAVMTLYEKGIPKNRIAKLTHIDPKTVRKIIRNNGVVQRTQRKDKIVIDQHLLQRLHTDCDGFIQRVYEKLTEEHGITISYATVRRLLGEYNIGDIEDSRSERVADRPGEEMQHDTSVHWVCINGTKQKLICSGLYIRYSKMRYIKYYRRFNRFTMQCFIDESLRFFGYTARKCIIDNTSLAIDYGSGSRAIFSPEMAAFARKYGFEWHAHEINHANRKAGKERNFRTIETNFLPGRTFRSLMDLNQQARQWATERYAHRPHSKTKLIPSELFEHEKSALIKLPDFIYEPYRKHTRMVDQYGYVSFNGNYYWVPSSKKFTNMSLIEYADRITIYANPHTRLLTYQLCDEFTKNQICDPPDKKSGPRRHPQPNNLKKDCRHEERILISLSPGVRDYVEFVKSHQSGIAHRTRFIRHLYALMKKTTPLLFEKVIQRALQYKVNHMQQLINMFAAILKQPVYEKPSSFISSDFEKRDTYIAGCFTQENDIHLE